VRGVTRDNNVFSSLKTFPSSQNCVSFHLKKMSMNDDDLTNLVELSENTILQTLKERLDRQLVYVNDCCKSLNQNNGCFLDLLRDYSCCP
jgi:myosin heavy subunit